MDDNIHANMLEASNEIISLLQPLYTDGSCVCCGHTNVMSSAPISQRNAQQAAARFGQSYGYGFDGDTVVLHASVQLLDRSAQDDQWLFQLRATPVANGTGVAPRLHVIAEAPLPSIADLSDTGNVCSLTAFSSPPAGQGEYNLSLALLVRRKDQPDELHDLAVFSRPEQFPQPCFSGNPGCTIDAGQVTISTGRIENPRVASNTSGTLSLELWALSEPYTGGMFQGQPLAGIVLGRLDGQSGWENASYTLNYAPPPTGSWHATVMLREWTGASYTTRDYRNLPEFFARNTAPKPPAPVSVVAPPPVAEPKKAVPVKTPAAPTTAPAAKKAAQGKSPKRSKSGK